MLTRFQRMDCLFFSDAKLCSPRPAPAPAVSKRAYAQVTRVDQSTWRCPDGQTFRRSSLAHMHLRLCKEQKLAERLGEVRWICNCIGSVGFIFGGGSHSSFFFRKANKRITDV
jgi:hypothetical protein